MSSPPPIDFPTSDLDDVQMQDDHSAPLFLAATPSAAGTPTQFETPVRGIAARRALGMSTPLFAPGSSSPLAYPSSSPAKTPRARVLQFPDSDPLDFPSSPVKLVTPKNRRGDIHSSLSLTPQPQRRIHPRPNNNNNDLSSDANLDIPLSSAPNLSAAPLPSDEPDEIRAIWGTTVNLGDTMKSFRDFLKGFKPKYRAAYDREHGHRSRVFNSPEDADILLYESYLRRMRQTGETNLNLDVVNLLAYPPSKKLYTQLVKYPQEVIPAMDQILKDLMLEVADLDQQADVDGMQGDEGDAEIAELMKRVYKVRPFGLPSVNMRDLNPTDTDKLVCIKGLVIRATPVIPDMKVAFFRCLTCSHTTQVDIERGKIQEPSRCPRDVCNTLGSMSLIHNRCEFADRQVIRLQETPDSVPDGQTPHTVSLSVYDELVDVCKPGDRVVVTGIFRSVPVRVNPRQRSIRSLFKTYVDVVHLRIGMGNGFLGLDRSTREAGGGDVRVPGVGSLGGVGDGMEDDEDDNSYSNGMKKKTSKAEMEEKLKELSKRSDLYELLAKSLAPSIWEMEDVKKGILLQLFGGTNKSVARGGGGGGPRYRGDINVLLVGDPGVSKSQILQYVHKIAPRGVYTSGKGSSAVGLTAYVTRDPDSKQLVLESGALVLSDGGICCIDEFDKMSDSTRSVLHEVMEQQTVSIAKAGIITTLNARTSILAAANPVGSKYDVNLPVTRNIDLPPTLISRFDLIYLVLDRVDEGDDRRLARFLVGLYLEDRPESLRADALPQQELAAYITYAKSNINPIISEEAGTELVSSYVEMRNLGSSDSSSSSQSQSQSSFSANSEKRITATTRQLESMIRLSEAHARMRFSMIVEKEDVKEAYRLMRDAIKTSAMDPRTGKIDMSLLTTGTSSNSNSNSNPNSSLAALSARVKEDMKKAIIELLDSNEIGNGSSVGIKARSGRGVKWNEFVKVFKERSTVGSVDDMVLKEVVEELEDDGLVRVGGERERKVLKRV